MRPLLTRVDAVLFDLDGTLVDTNIDFPLMKQKTLALAAEYGLDPAGLGSLDILAIVERAVRSLESAGNQEAADRLRMRATAMLEEIELRHAHDTRLIPHAREMIAELRLRGIRTGVVTRNCRSASLISLEIAGIVPDALVCREDTARHKPHPEQLHKALEMLGCVPAHSVMVGDHIMDVEGGKAAGMKTIAFLRDSRPPDFFDEVGPDLVARDLTEVLDAIVHRHC